MRDFVQSHSIVRTVWGNSDIILLIFAGSAAEFALNRAVDWLFFTNQIPRDPIGRLFSTVRYAQEIVFVDEATAQRTLDRISAIHHAVERQRGQKIPEWAFRDVLYMLVDYSERAYELLYRPLTLAERQEMFAAFRRVGAGMHIPDLPETYAAYQADRHRHLDRDLAFSRYTDLLYKEYRRHLGAWRYELLLHVQSLLVPEQVLRLLRLRRSPLLSHALWLYRIFDELQLRSLVQWALLPPRYLDEVRQMERAA